jgi:sec-independent protein translocase protein TatA
MFEGAFQPMHWVVVLAIVLIVFGPSKLPELGKGLGAAIRNFKESLSAGADDPAKDDIHPTPPSAR